MCIPSPSRKMENLLADIIDIQVIQSLMNDFYKLAHIPVGLNDLKGNVLVSVAEGDDLVFVAIGERRRLIVMLARPREEAKK